MRRLTMVAILVPVATLLVSCKPGALMRKVRSEPPTASQALKDQPSCKKGELPEYSTPMVVDMKGAVRGDLEVAMRQGLVAVRWDCDTLEVLPDCRAEGSYGYFGFTPKQELVRLEDNDELKANLPVSAGVIGAELGGEFQRGTTLDIALMMIGKQRTTRGSIARADLVEDRPGACETATHFVRGATLGAFVLKTGSKAEATTAATLFGLPHVGKIGTSGATSSKEERQSSDGSVEACGGATPRDAEPPGACGALLRLELNRIDPAGAAVTRRESPQVQDPCGGGRVLAQGKCTEAVKAKTYLCKPSDVKDCEAQCTLGDAGSCSRMGYFRQEGLHGQDKDPAAAAALYDKACEGGWPLGCASLAALHAQGIGVKRDPKKAVTLLTRACDAGWPTSCSFLGTVMYMGNLVPKDRSAAVPFLRRGCEGGAPEGCFLLAEASRNGEGGEAKDPGKARRYFRMGCDGGDPMSCFGLGVALQNGIGGAKDAPGARAPFDKACKSGLAEACEALGKK